MATASKKPAAKKAPTPAVNHASGAVSLKVLAERKEVDGVAKRTSFNVAPGMMEVYPGFNGRPIDRERVDSFKTAKRGGAVFPDYVVWVDDGHIYILDGHHRNVADMELIAEGVSVPAVPCVEFKGDEAARIAFMIGVNDGNPLTPMQLGTQYKKLSVLGWTPKAIADTRGKSEQHVKDMILLAESEGDVKAMVEAGHVSGTTALKAVKTHGKKAGKVMGEALVKVKAAGKTKVTDRALADKAADAYVREVKEQSKAAAAHLAAMLDSPSMSDVQKSTIKATMSLMKIKPTPAPTDSMKLETGLYWLQELSANTKCRQSLREGAKWLHSLIQHPDRPVVTPPDGAMSLEEALYTEMNTGGQVKAETMCKQHTAVISYLRNGGE